MMLNWSALCESRYMKEIVIDPYSLSSLYVETFFNEVKVSSATAFTFKFNNKIYLVSNWHVLSGRNPHSGQPLSKSGIIPNRIRVALPNNESTSSWYGPYFQLCDASLEACWIQHPKGQDIDVAALEIQIPSKATHFPINEQKNHPMSISVASDVFVIGFPLGILTAGALPVWKRASIASEPEVDVDDLPKILLDTATREGMSGSPVIARTRGPYDDGSGQVKITSGMGATKFLGVYSGRIGDQHLGAQLGVMWKRNVIEEILNAGVKGGFILRDTP